MSSEQQDSSARKQEKVKYCQECGACASCENQQGVNGDTSLEGQQLESLIRRVTEEVLRELKRR